MTNITIRSPFSPPHFLFEETNMEKILERRTHFNLRSRGGMVNVYYALELKFFMYKLLFSRLKVESNLHE